MVGPTLLDIREHIEALASDDGRYYVVCGRTGDRPVPVARHRFPDRATARAAVRATEQYRAALRRYDPRVPCYDPIVCQDAEVRTTTRQDDSTVATLSEPVLDDATPGTRCELVEFCHQVAGAVFETLSEAGYGTVETAVMDTYFELATSVDDPDEFCLCLLESMAGELDEQLHPSDQAEVVTSAAQRLGSAETASDPLAATLSTLGGRGLIEWYAHSPWAVCRDPSPESVVAHVDGYPFRPREGRLPVLPLVLELSRHQPDRLPTSVGATAVNDGWQLVFRFADAAEQDGLVNAPIDGERL